LNNIEPNRNLTSFADKFTFADDPHEYRPPTIGPDGTLTSVPNWTFAHDGLVLPLRVSSTDTNDFQPKTTVSHSSKPAKYLAINGTPRGGNLWRSAALDSAYCHFHRPPTPAHEKICGHFREWGGMPNDPIVKSASSVTIDMEAHNKYCKSTS